MKIPCIRHVFHCVFLVHIQLQTLCHNLWAHVVWSCCHMQVQWYMLRSLFHVKFHLQKVQITRSTTNIMHSEDGLSA